MVLVPAGPFTMGSDDTTETRRPFSSPAHIVLLDSFLIDRFEVTQAQYSACVDAEICPPAAISEDGISGCTWGRDGYSDHPINCVPWYAARQYCDWVGLRLPTEAEWEKAARSDDRRTYPWGEQMSCEHGNFDDDTTRDPFVMPGGQGCDGFPRTAPVGSFPRGRSAYDVEDMAGNVAEWVNDTFEPDYYLNSPLENPTGSLASSDPLFRGGSWDSGHETLWTWKRNLGGQKLSTSWIGFRCAQDAVPHSD